MDCDMHKTSVVIAGAGFPGVTIPCFQLMIFRTVN
jgi:hypothetical protein